MTSNQIKSVIKILPIKKSLGPELWRSGLILPLQCRHPIWLPVLVPAVPLPIQLSTMAQEGSKSPPKSLGPCIPMEDPEKAPGCRHLGSEPGDGRTFCLFPLTVCNAIKKKKKKPRHIAKFYKTRRSELTPILLQLFQRPIKEGTLPNPIYKFSITLRPTPKTQQKIAEQYPRK